jgi:hypothetical protein
MSVNAPTTPILNKINTFTCPERPERPKNKKNIRRGILPPIKLMFDFPNIGMDYHPRTPPSNRDFLQQMNKYKDCNNIPKKKKLQLSEEERLQLPCIDLSSYYGK